MESILNPPLYGFILCTIPECYYSNVIFRFTAKVFFTHFAQHNKKTITGVTNDDLRILGIEVKFNHYVNPQFNLNFVLDVVLLIKVK